MDKLFAPPEKPTGTLGRLYERFHRNLRFNYRTVGIVDVRDWAEMAEKEIARLHGVSLTETYASAKRGKEYPLPSGCLAIDAVKLVEDGGKWAYDIKYGVTDNGTIYFPQDGTFDLVYKKAATPLAAELTENLSTDQVFHGDIDHYIMYSYYKFESDAHERDRADQYLQKFYSGISVSAQQLTDRAKRSRRVRSH